MSIQNTIRSRQFTRFEIQVGSLLKKQMLNWADQFNICCFMDNNFYPVPVPGFECMVAAGAWKAFQPAGTNTFSQLKEFWRNCPEWLFGHFGFDLKTETEQVRSELPDPIGFSACHFFEPEHLLLLRGNELFISSYTMSENDLFDQILPGTASIETDISTTGGTEEITRFNPAISLKENMGREEYINRVNLLKAHIHRGDCYEINFCQEFSAEGIKLNPQQVFKKLSEISPNPFSVFYKVNNHYLLCASPERYLQIDNGIVRSQPIKGTAPRYLLDVEADVASAKKLKEDPKERSENIMVVDLVRNDLSKFCVSGSVVVEELCSIQSFPQVHQMVSTVMGKLAPAMDWVDAVRHSFPMGSMTGAPKKRVLELIEENELVSRGLFSGAVGYCTPDGNADFNVVIRSVQYNASSKYVSCLVGSAITWKSDPEKEYDECLLKASAIRLAIGDQ